MIKYSMLKVLFSMIKYSMSKVEYMTEINLRHLEIIFHNDWRGECLSSPDNQSLCHQPRPSQDREIWYSEMPDLWKERRYYKDTGSDGPNTVAQCVSLILTHSYGSSDNGVPRGAWAAFRGQLSPSFHSFLYESYELKFSGQLETSLNI